MTIRDEIIPLIDSVRRDVVDVQAGFRLHTIQTRLRVWDGGEVGRGTPTDTDVTLDPVPRWREPTPRERSAEPGRYQDGDVIVTKISATYTEDDLTGGALGAASEWFWLVDGEPYRVASVHERIFEWRVHLRRMRRRP